MKEDFLLKLKCPKCKSSQLDIETMGLTATCLECGYKWDVEKR